MVLRGALIVAALAALAPAGASAQDASRALARQHRQLSALLARPASASRDARLERHLDGALDYAMITRRALVVHWEGLSEAQRAEVSGLLERAIRQRYRRSLEALEGWDVEVLSETARGIGVRVTTRATRGDEAREIAYDLLREGRRWRITNIVFDGEGLIDQYRVQFDHVIRRHGWDGFVERLRENVERGAS